MVVSYYGFSFVRVQSGELTIAFNPPNPTVAKKPVRFAADIALISLRDPRYNHPALLARGEKRPFVIEGPGEYEIGGVFIRGFQSPGPDQRINTIYFLSVGGLRLVHLGAVTAAELSPEMKEELGPIDLLFLPIGGAPLLDYKQAAKLLSELEPKLIVPIDYSEEKILKSFLRERGEETKAAVESFTLKRKDLSEQTGEVVVIKS